MAIQNSKFKIKTSRSGIIIASGIFALISITTLTATILAHTTGGVYTGLHHASATSTSDSVAIDVKDSCTLSGDIDDDKEHTISVNSGTYTKDIGETTLNAICNDPNGYSVYAIGYGNDTDGNTDLTGTNTGLTIPTGTSTDTTISNWSMKLSAVTGTYTPTILSDTNGSYANYHIVPNTYTKVFTYTNDVNTANASQAKTTYAVAVTNSQSPDTYIGKVKYLLVHPNYSNPDGSLETYNIPITFSGDGVASVTITTDDPNVTPASQTITTSGDTATMTAGVPYAMTMAFDDNYEFDSWSLNDSSYGALSSTTANPTTFTPNANSVSAVIAAAGKSSRVYMQDFTKLQCSALASSSNYIVYDRRDDSDYTIRYVNNNCWMTQNLRITNSTGKSVGVISAADSNFTGADLTMVGGAISADYASAQYHESGSATTGLWYNFCAAGARTSSACNRTSDYSGSSDICPSNWRLPTKADFDGVNGFAYTAVLSPIIGGGYYKGSFYLPDDGYWWSATAYNSGKNQYVLRYNVSSGLVTAGHDKNLGLFVRCVHRS